MNARTAFLINEEVTKIQNHLGSVYVGYEENVETKVAKAFLLFGNYTYNGRWLRPKARSLGAGVYAVSVEDSPGIPLCLRKEQP